MTDFITLLRTYGPIVTKRWTAEGILPYDDAKTFQARERAVNNIHELSTLLFKVESDPRTIAVRGKWDGIGDLRQKSHYAESSHHWLMLDIDWYEPVLADPVLEPRESIAEFIGAHLPPEFADRSHHWQLSSSAGAPGKEHVLKAHIFFWLDKPQGHRELDGWWAATGRKVDRVAWRRVQALYTAAPVIDPGVTCPVVERSGFVQGASDVVSLVVPEVRDHVDSYNGKTLANPGENTKHPQLGLFCRAYSPTRVIEELLPDEFEFQDDSDVRLNWLGSASNSAGSAYIGRDGHHIINVSNTAPESERALNSWDVCRVYKFGHLDVDASDFEMDNINTWPSELAMRAWVRDDPEVRAALSAQARDEILDDDRDPFAPDPVEAAAEEMPVKMPEFDDRAVKLQRTLDAITRSPSTQDLEHRLAPLLRAMELSDGDRAQCCSAVQSRFKALSNTPLPIATVRGWLKPAAGSTGFTDITEEGRYLGTLENVAEVLRRMEAIVRYNTMSKEDEIVIARQNFSVDNRANVTLGLVLSECSRLDMKITPGAIKTYINILAERNPYNPPLEWMLGKPWDGVDRMQAWYDTVTTPNKPLKEILMYRWALQLVAILYNNGENMARGVLTFTGAQYAGKTRWLKALAPDGMVLAGHVLDIHNKDSIKKAISYWITEFGEVDGTMRKSDLSGLKAFISQMDDELRLPYAMAASKFPRRSGFGATVNDVEFLRDPTGNTRYWTMQADAIDADHGIDMQQFWAQMHHVWLNGGKPLQHWLTMDEMKLLNASNEDFTETDPLEEAVRSKMDWHTEGVGRIWSTATQIAERLGMRNVNRFEAARLGSVVRRVNGNQFRKSHGTRLLQVPASADDLGVSGGITCYD